MIVSVRLIVSSPAYPDEPKPRLMMDAFRRFGYPGWGLAADEKRHSPSPTKLNSPRLVSRVSSLSSDRGDPVPDPLTR